MSVLGTAPLSLQHLWAAEGVDDDDDGSGRDSPRPYCDQVEEAGIHDNGYYSCHYIGATDYKNDKENADFIYVFVSSDYASFVKMHTIPVTLKPSETLIIECATTHPEIHVSLMKDGTDITDEERVKFNPREGFEIKHVTMDDKGEYICKHNYDELEKHVTITSSRKLSKPSIDVGINQYLAVGEKFSLKCSVVDYQNITFHWTYPNKKANYTQKLANEPQSNSTYSNSILEVPKASEADNGTYTCTINSSYAEANSVSQNIVIHKIKASFVNIEGSKKIEAVEGQLETVKWRTDLLSYPAHPIIKYTDWRGQELKQTDRIIIQYEKEKRQSWLKFKNITSSDFGNYTINVTTTDGKGKNSTTVLIEVKSVPHVTMEPEAIPLFIEKGKILNVTCVAQGFPLARVRVQFQECSSGYTSCSPFSSNQTKDVDPQYPAPGNIVRKSILFSPNTSGFLLCSGNNEKGSEDKTALIQISDINGIFVLRHSGQHNITEVKDHKEVIRVVENDNFTLLCGGTKFNYSKVELEHSPQFGSPVQLARNDSEFSWKTKIIQRKATKTLAGNYTCTAHPHGNESLKVKIIHITVDDEEQVEFKEESNMRNQTEVVKGDVGFSLMCIVTGTPTPTIQWMKDKKNLTTESDIFDKMAMNFSSDFQVLEFHYVLKKHTGLYTCTAKNRLNKVTRSLTLRLPDPGMSKAVKWSLAIAIVGIAALGIVVVCLMNRVKKERRIKRSFKQLRRNLFETGNIKSLNPACTADTQAEMLPYDKKSWEMPRQNITLGKQLGAGAFGRVIKATVKGLEGPATTTVAVKMSKNDVDASQTRALIAELKIMMHLGKHLNIVNLMGANTQEISTGELWILVEYCRFGNLLEFMKRHRRKFINQVCPETGEINHSMVLFSPMSPSLSDSYPTPAVDQDGYLAPSAQKFVLSDPPLGRSTGSAPSSYMNSENLIPQETADHCVSNPLYNMGIGATTEDPKKESRGSEDSRNPNKLQRKGSRLLSIGSITLSDGSVSHPLRSPDTNMEQFSTHSPLSPTDSHFTGETGSDFILEVGNVPGLTAPFSTSDLICWGWQVAHGMEYLSRRKILHGDLAARNLLLADKNVVKISDFGLSRNMYRNNNYVKKGDDLLPVMWMSIEAIRDSTFSIESDVWAFGITMWEIFSLGNAPYRGMKFDDDFMQKLEEGYRMSCPQYANHEIYNIMKKCWEECPLERPSFSQLVEDLGLMVMPDLKQEYLSQNDMYVQMNEERFKNETDYLNMMASPNFESMPMPEEAEVSQYVNVSDQTRNSVSIQLPDTAAYCKAESPPSSSNLSPGGSDYLAMDSFKLQSPSSDVMSPQPSKPSRFPFSSNPESSRLTPLPEDEKLLASEDPSKDFALTSMRKQLLPEGDLS